MYWGDFSRNYFQVFFILKNLNIYAMSYISCFFATQEPLTTGTLIISHYLDVLELTCCTMQEESFPVICFRMSWCQKEHFMALFDLKRC